MARKTRRKKLKPKICEMCQGEVPAGKNRILMDGRRICPICYDEEISKIPDPVARARKRFERCKKQKIDVDFDTLLELLKNDCNTYTQIGEEIGGLTREGIRRTHKKHFFDIPHLKPTGHMRQKVCTRKRRSRLATETFRSLPELQPIIKEAERRGYRVHPIMVKEPGVSEPCKSRLIINGHKCLVRKVTRPQIRGESKFWISLNLAKRYDFLICQLGSQRKFLVTPTSVLLSFPEGKKKGKKSVFVYPQVDWHQYADAWHLLE